MEQQAIAEHWADDTLERWRVAQDFSKIILSLPAKNDEAWVVCIDAPYGAGKSFIVERWRKDLEREPFKACSLFYNAWEFDYTDDAFVSFSAEIIDQLAIHSRTGVDALKEVVGEMTALYRMAWPLFKAMYNIPDVPMQELEKIKIIKDTVLKAKELKKKVSQTHAQKRKEELVQADLLEVHRQSKEAIKKFREFLSTAAKLIKQKTGKPLVIFVDEIDRCKPTFAIRLLERIKHVFNVPNLIFVVMTNKHSLAQSVKAVYGASFNSEEYLERFFDLPLLLPSYDSGGYVSSMLAADLNSENDIRIKRLKGYSGFFVTCATKLKLNLREKKKALELAKIAVWAMPAEKWEPHAASVLMHQFIFLCCLKSSSCNELYSALGQEIVSLNSFEPKLNDWIAKKFVQGEKYKLNRFERAHFSYVLESLFYHSGSHEELRGKLNIARQENGNPAREFHLSLLAGMIAIVSEGDSLRQVTKPTTIKGQTHWELKETTFVAFMKKHLDYIST